MNRKLLIFCPFVVLVLLMAVGLRAQTPAASSHAAIEKQVVTLERAVNEAVAKGDMKGFHANVSSDAVSVDASGINKVNAPEFDKMLLASKIQSWDIDGSQFYWISESSVVHMYRWTGKGTYEGQPIPSPVWSSTVWTNKGGKWLATFHAESVAMSAPPPAAAKPTTATPTKK